MPHPLVHRLLGFAARLRHPQLFVLVAALFLLDLLVPDPIPFADEVLLGLITLILGRLRTRPAVSEAGTGNRRGTKEIL